VDEQSAFTNASLGALVPVSAQKLNLCNSGLRLSLFLMSPNAVLSPCPQ